MRTSFIILMAIILIASCKAQGDVEKIQQKLNEVELAYKAKDDSLSLFKDSIQVLLSLPYCDVFDIGGYNINILYVDSINETMYDITQKDGSSWYRVHTKQESYYMFQKRDVLEIHYDNLTDTINGSILLMKVNIPEREITTNFKSKYFDKF